MRISDWSSDVCSSDLAPRLSVDIVSDVMCPWCIIGWLKFRKVIDHFAGRLDFRVQWHPFELNPDMPAEGEDAASHVMRKYGISAEQSRANGGRLAGIADELGFAFNRGPDFRSEEHTSELQSLMRISYAVFCLKKKKKHL